MGLLYSYQCLRRRRKIPFYVVAFLSFLSLLLGAKIIISSGLHGDGKLVGHASSLAKKLKDDDPSTTRASITFIQSVQLEYEEVIGTTANTADAVEEQQLPEGELLISREESLQGSSRQFVNRSKVEINLKPNITQSDNRKYLILLGHYEQLGMSTVNFFNGVYLAHSLKRLTVLPLVRHSRFCGIPGGWSGMLRKGTRRFIPMSTYYNESHLYNLLRSQGTNGFVNLTYFFQRCSRNAGQKLTVIYLIYNDDPLAYLKLSQEQLQDVKEKASKDGWTNCDFVNDKLNIENRFEADIEIGRQICVDAEVIKDVDAFEKHVTGRDTCAAILQWRGVGEKRTHFNFSSFVPPKILLPLVKPSNVVLNEVNRFSNKFHIKNKRYIGVHIRSERQILWLGIARLKKCLHLLTKTVKDLQKEKNIYKVLIASDTGKYGSDQIFPYLNKSESREVVMYINDFIKSVQGLTYQVRKPKDPLWTDTGLVALVELHLLARSEQLITLGAGTFQNWLIDVFQLHKSEFKIKSWTITRACQRERKKGKEKKGPPKD